MTALFLPSANTFRIAFFFRASLVRPTMDKQSYSSQPADPTPGQEMHLRKPQATDTVLENDMSKKTSTSGHESFDEAWGDTPTDQLDMLRMGKKQEFKRNFSFLSALAFVSVYMATWEFVLVSLSVGFSNGGFAGLFWCFITTVLAYSTVVASLAEMASMAPTAGGWYSLLDVLRED